MRTKYEHDFPAYIETNGPYSRRYYGGGDAPMPDQKINEAAAANVKLGQDALDFSKQQYTDLTKLREHYQPQIDAIIKQQLDLGDKQSAQSDDYTNYMKTTFRPIEQGLAKDATDFDTDAKRAELAGKAGSDVEQAAGQSDEAARRDAARFGVNPSDAAFSQNLAGTALNKTIMKVGAMNNATTQARAEGRALKFDVANMGRGLPSASASAAQIASQVGSTAANTATIPGATARADGAVVNQGFNQAMAGNSSAGNLYGNVFDARMRGYGADQQAQAGMYGGLGTLAGMALIASSRGIKVTKGKVDPEKVLAKVIKLPVDRWKYKKGVADEGEHIGTYAEDFRDTFGVGDGKAISVVDAIGVTMAAVQGLAKKMDRIAVADKPAARIARMGVAS